MYGFLCDTIVNPWFKQVCYVLYLFVFALCITQTVHVWKVARYTCSSPLYFGEHDNYIDTGVVCKNLCGVGLEKINSYYEKFGQNIIDPISMVVSLGDGHLPAQQLGSTGRLSTLFLRSNPNTKGLLPVFQNLVALYTSAAVSTLQ